MFSRDVQSLCATSRVYCLRINGDKDKLLNLKTHMAELIGTQLPLGMEAVEFDNLDLRIEKLDTADSNSIMLDAVKYLVSDQVKSGTQYKPKWNDGWTENLESYLASKQEIDLIPKYITKNKVFRIKGEFYSSPNPFFEIDFARLILLNAITKYLGESNTIVDIGCGSCHYTLWLAKKFYEKTFYALDWVQPSLKIAGHLANDFAVDIRPQEFDMFNPRLIDFGSRSKIALSIGALEQLGDSFEDILDWFKLSDFDTIINIEPIVEFYDNQILFDFVAQQYVIKRNWLNGYFTRIKELAGLGEVEILEQRRIFGSKFHETYNLVIWRYKK